MQPSSFTDFNFADFTMGTPGDMGSFNFDTTSPGGTNGTSLDDLFGGSATYNNLGAFSPYSVGTSPISHPGSSSGQSPPVPSPPAQSSSQAAHGDRCPSKEDLALFVAAAGPSSFAPQENSHMTVDGGKVIFHGSKLPPTDKNETNIDAYTAMQKLKTHPRYKVCITSFIGYEVVSDVTQECDMNELCAEFAAKARCDGSKAVIPQEGMNELMDRMSTGHNGQA
jgi:AP-1-like factor